MAAACLLWISPFSQRRQLKKNVANELLYSLEERWKTKYVWRQAGNPHAISEIKEMIFPKKINICS